jgi:pimeloyl-ACP methyl ester carboxylesterase
MADDTAGLMAELGIERAHIVGTSLGGYIAQEVALRHPARTKGLVLVCTAAGGADAVPMPDVTVQLMQTAPSLPVEDRLRVFTRNCFSPAFLEAQTEIVDEIVGHRLATGQTHEQWLAQATAGANHDTSARLRDVAAPTLVITGTQDNVVDPRNSKILAERIPNATLVEMPGGHLFMFEDPDTFNRHVLTFLAEHCS